MAERSDRVTTFALGALAGVCAAASVAVVLSSQKPTAPVQKKAVEAAAPVQKKAEAAGIVPDKPAPAATKPAAPAAPKAAAAATAPAPKQTVADEVSLQDKPQDANDGCVGVSSDLAGKASSCSGCPNQKSCASGEAKKPDPAVADVKDRLANVKRKILVLSGKGGVGKSTVSAQLSFGFAARNMDAGLLDVDICGPSVPRMLGLMGQDVHQSSEGWSPVYVDDRLAVMSIGFMLPNQDDAIIWRGPRKNGLIKQFLTDVNWGALDALVIDTPPGTSDEHLSIVTYLQDSSMDGAVIVTTPQEVSLMDVRKEINFCHKVNLPVLGVIENMSGFVCPNCSHTEHIFSPTTGGAEAMCKAMNVPFLGRIPLDGKVARAGDSGQPLVQLNPDSEVAKCIDAVVGKILSETDRRRAL